MSESDETRVFGFTTENMPGREPVERYETWSEFVALLQQARTRQPVKQMQPLWKPLTWHDLSKGQTKENVEAVDFLVVDIDHGLKVSQLGDLVVQLALGGHQCLLHTTYSHGCKPEDEARLHCIFPLKDSIIPNKNMPWEVEWEYLVSCVGLREVADPHCANLTRGYFLPDSESQCFHILGRPLEVKE